MVGGRLTERDLVGGRSGRGRSSTLTSFEPARLVWLMWLLVCGKLPQCQAEPRVDLFGQRSYSKIGWKLFGNEGGEEVCE